MTMKKILIAKTLKICFLIVIAFAASNFFSQTVEAATRYWVGGAGGCDGTFDDSDCWSTSAGGAGGASVPGSIDVAQFTSDDTTSCTIDSTTTISSLITNSGYTGAIDFDNAGITINSNLTVNSTTASFTAPPAGQTFEIGLDFTFGDGDDFIHNNGKIDFIGSSNASAGFTLGDLLFNDLEIAKTTSRLRFTSGGEIEGEWTLTSGNLETNTAPIESTGTVDWVNTGSTGFNTPNIIFDNTADVVIEAIDDIGNITVRNNNKSDIVVSIGSSLSSVEIRSITIDGGTFDNANNATIDMFTTIDINAGELLTGTGTFNAARIQIDGGTFTNESTLLTQDSSSDEIEVNSGLFDGGSGTINIEGNGATMLDINGGTFTSTSGTLTGFGPIDIESGATFNANGGTIELQITSNEIFADDGGNSFNNIILTGVDTNDYLNVSSDLDINGDLTINSGDFRVNNNTINIAGDLTMADSANAEFANGATGTIILDGTNQTVDGPFNDSHTNPSAFQNFTKQVTTTDTLTFNDTYEYEFNGTLTLTGTSGNYLLLRSQTDGQQTDFRPDGTRNINFVNVRDNNNVSGTDIDLTAADAINAGNNLNWLFPPSTVVPEFSTYLYIFTLLAGFYLIYRRQDQLGQIFSK